jgi:hypothetical protein
VQADVPYPVCLFLRIAMLLCQPNLGKTCPIIFLSLMPLVSSYLSKAYQLNPWPCDLCDGHRNMLEAELTVFHRTPSPTSLGYGHPLFISSGHDLFGSLLVTILTGRVSLYIVTLAQSIGVVWDFLLVMSGIGVMTKIDDTATKPGAFYVCAHTVVLLGTC